MSTRSPHVRPVVEPLEGRRLLSDVPWATGQVIRLEADGVPLADGAILDAGVVGTRFDVKAAAAGPVGSVAYTLDGQPLGSGTGYPFAVGGPIIDAAGWGQAPAAHTLVATPFAGEAAQGLAGQPVTVRFTVERAGPFVPGTAATTPIPVLSPPPVAVKDSGGAWVTVGGSAADPAAPTPVIKLLGQSGVAGHAVHVNALDSTLASGTAITAKYEWDFGDPAGEYNTLRGWNAAHVYDTPGDYTITLTLTNDAGRTSTVTAGVRVGSDTRRTIYVDKDGSDQNTGLSPDAPVQSAGRAGSLIRSNTRVLFRRGESFDTFDWIDVHSDNVYLGAYGTGDDPVLNVRGRNAIYVTKDATNTVVEHVTFDSPYAVTGTLADKTPADAGLFVGGTNTLVRACTFLNLDDAVNTNPKPTGVFVLDSIAPLDTGIRGYFYWGEGSDAVLLGNRVANSTREHNIRLSGATRVLVADNELANLNRQKVDKQDYSKGTVEVQKGSYVYVAGNTLRGGPLRAGPRGEATEPASTTTDWTVFEGNKVFDYQVDVYPGTHHLMLRNNVLTNNNKSAIAINPMDPQGRDISDIQILNNTGINSGMTGQFLRTTGAAPAGSITLGNNLYVAPHLTGGGYGTAPVYVAQGDLVAFASIYNNVWPVPETSIKFGQGGINWVWPTYTGQAGFKTPKEWAAYPQVSGDVFANVPIDAAYRPSAAALVGRPVGSVLDDVAGIARPSGGLWAVGAAQP